MSDGGTFMVNHTNGPIQPPARRRSALRTGCIGLLAVGAIGAIVGQLANQTAGGTSPALGPDLEPLERHCDDAWASGIRNKAERGGLIRGHQLDATRLIVLVRPQIWYSLSLPSQQTLALAESCRVDRGFALLTVSFRFDPGGDDLLRMTPYDLFPLARGQFVAKPAVTAPAGVGDLSWGQRRPADLKPVIEGGSLFVPSKPGAFLGMPARDQDYDFDGGRLRGGHYFFDGPKGFADIKMKMKDTYGPPSWRELDSLSQTYGWEWRDKRIAIEARYDLTKETTTVTLERSEPGEQGGR
jgi:hypothetical protein